MYLKDIEDIRSIEWRKDWYWDILFPEAPEPFDKWFPASDVEEQVASLNMYPIEGPVSGYKIPHSSNPLGIRISFYDDMENTLLDWMTDWIREIINPYKGYVLPLSQCCKYLYVVRMNSLHKVVKKTSYLVIPDANTVIFHGGSDATSNPLSYEFHIVKRISVSNESDIALEEDDRQISV